MFEKSIVIVVRISNAEMTNMSLNTNFISKDGNKRKMVSTIRMEVLKKLTSKLIFFPLALGIDRIYPGLIFFSKGYGKHGEPYRGYVLTFFISLLFLLIGKRFQKISKDIESSF